MATSNKNFKVKNGLDVSGAATANSFVKAGGSASEFLKADGSVSSVNVTTVRTNLVTNPNFETNMSNWSSNYYTQRITNSGMLYAKNGTYLLYATPDDETTTTAYYTKTNRLTIGTSYRAGAWVNIQGGGSTENVTITLGSASQVYSVPNNNSTWTFISTPAWTANTTTASLTIQFGSSANICNIDSVIIEATSTWTGEFFDGNTTDAGGVDYAWTGTANASTSTATTVTTFADIAGAIPKGGTTGQVLTKSSNTNYETTWTTPAGGSSGVFVEKAGDSMTGILTLSADPVSNFHAATKGYVDASAGSVTSAFQSADGQILGSISTINTSLGNKQDKVTNISDTEIGYLDGVTSAIQTQINNKQDKVTDVSDTEIGYLNGVTSAIQTQINNKQDKITDVSDTELGYLNGVTSAIQTQIDGKQNKVADVSDSEIGHLNGVTSAIQTQIDAKLGSTTAAGIYAPLNDPTFGGTVSLPGTTSIGDVSATEIGYLNGVTSSVQTQITSLDTSKAPKESPTFTGTVSGITSSMVGLGNVDNTSDANKPISTATQSALDTKLNLSGGTLTGPLTLSGAPTSDLHAATKLYVDGLSAGINFHQPVVAATVGNLAGTYNNGTNGFGATITKASNGAIGTIDGATVSVGSRILLRAQTDARENGVYTVTAVGSVSAPWQVTRATDADNNPAGELSTGDFVFTTGGSTNGSKGFILNTTGTITVGTTEISYTQFNASEAVIAGTNIDKNGETISVVNAPTFSGVVTATSGVAFSDGTQTKTGVPSLTTFVEKTASYTLDTLAHQDNLVEMNSTSPMTFTIPTNATLAWPIGASMDILQTNTGEVTIDAAVGVTLNRTPGNKLRERWSSATILKRGTDSWILYGDLKA